MSPESRDKCLSSNNGLNVGSRPVATADMHNLQVYSAYSQLETRLQSRQVATLRLIVTIF